jgi:mono/diheme cytochrome c family protein
VIRWPLIAIAGCGVVVTVTSFLAHDPERRSWEISPDMARSPAFGAQSANPYLADGRTDRQPVPGTVVRGRLPYRYENTVAGFVRAGRELASPFDEANPPDLGRGRLVYQTYCQVCHGARADGDGPVTRRGFPAPPSLRFGKALNMQDGHLFHVITSGFRKMPPYDSLIEPADRWQVIAYVRHLQGR